MRAVCLMLIVSLAACAHGPPGAQAREASVEVADAESFCPNLSDAERTAIESAKDNFMAAWYAREHCITMAEADRRLAIQAEGAIYPATEPGQVPGPQPDSIQAVQEAILKGDAATFAGLWIEHEPDYRVVVAFTRDAEATLAKYTQRPLFVALNRAGPSEETLLAEQTRLGEELSATGVRYAASYPDIKRGKLVFELAEDGADLRRGGVQRGVVIPSFAEFIDPPPLPYPAPPAPKPGDARVKAYPQFAHRTDMYASTLVGVKAVPATLELRRGCLVVVTETDVMVALWQASDALDLSDPLRVSVLNRLSGARIVAGEKIVLSGLQPGYESMSGARGDLSNTELQGTSLACPPPYRVVNGYATAALHAEQVRANRVDMLMQGQGLTRTAADARYEIEQSRLKDLRALNKRLQYQHAHVFAAAMIEEIDATAQIWLVKPEDARHLIPAALKDFVQVYPAPRSHAELAAAETELEAKFAKAGIVAEVSADALSGVLAVSDIKDAKSLSRAAVRGQIKFPAFTQIYFDYAQMLVAGSAEKMEAGWRRLEAAPDFAKLRALVEEVMTPAGATVSRAASLDETRFLIAYGYDDARELAALQRAGADPVNALLLMNGASTPRTRAILSNEVVAADFVSMDTNAKGPDGARTTVTLRVTEPWKGKLKRGDTFRMRFQSGFDETGKYVQAPGEPILLPGFPDSLEGQPWLLYMSDSLYKHTAFMTGGEAAIENSDGIFFPSRLMRIEGESLTGLAAEPVAETTTELRTISKAVQATFEKTQAHVK